METAKEMLSRVKDLKNSRNADVLKDPGRATVAAASTGAIVGLFIGLRRRENIMLFVLAGAAIGGLAARIFVKART
jgi:hypothetical protein